MLTIVPVVEGHGEVSSLPVLIRRMAAEICPAQPLRVAKPIRARRSQVVLPGRLEDFVQLAAEMGGPDGRILVLLDADTDCPAELAPVLLQRATEARSDRKIAVVLPKAEFEAWFVAAASSVAEQLDLLESATAVAEAESIRNPKKWLSDRMPAGQSYRPTRHQPSLSARFDLALARENSPSFDKMWRSMEDLLANEC